MTGKEFVFQGTNLDGLKLTCRIKYACTCIGDTNMHVSHSQKLYNRECERVDRGLARVVPKFQEACILQDSWMKLNVAPAKIMVKFMCVH